MKIPLRVQIFRIHQTKLMKFDHNMTIAQCCLHIKEKTTEGSDDHGLFQPAS